MDYQAFLESKKLVAPSVGIEVETFELNQKLFPFQRAIVQVALAKGRYALFEECGLGKTFQQIEWARIVAERTGGKVLILAPLAVAAQTVLEGQKLGVAITYCRSQEEVSQASTSIIISNYEMLKALDPSMFVGVVLDESSILKNFMGATKRLILEAFRTTPYRLACTATPAPNDHLELGNHAEFLGVMPANEMLMRWFINDTMQAGNYRLKKWSEHDYWRWVTTWAVCISKPSDLGFSDDTFELPPLEFHQHGVAVDHTRAWEGGKLFLEGNLNATNIWKDKSATLEARCAKALEIINSNPEVPWIVWCDLNEESSFIASHLPQGNFVEVRGSDKLLTKETRLLGFARNEVPILVTKAEIAGLGMNFQHCADMVYVGSNFSYEKLHQSLRRCYRFRQTKTVNAHIIVSETDNNLIAAINRKQRAFVEMQRSMTAAMRQHGLFGGDQRKALIDYDPQVEATIPDWLRSKAS
jgi:hypothetical protein